MVVQYGAREISAQLGNGTGELNYKNLQKVYSIWICNENVPKPLQNTVSVYEIHKTDAIGSINEPKENYDLLSVIIIRRGSSNSNAEIFDYLQGIFSSNIKQICKYVNIQDNKEIMKGVKTMQGLGQSLSDKAYQKGILQGQKNAKKAFKSKLLQKDEQLQEKDNKIAELEALIAELQKKRIKNNLHL